MRDDGGSLQEGAVLSGAYRIVRLIGRGGMGEVYEAIHQRTGASFAIKVLAAAPQADEAVMERFRREAEVTSRLKHPHIVKVFDFDRLPDGRPFLAMELLQGSDLAALAATQGLPLPVARVASIVDQISLALFAAHQAGVVHRDLKPANIFIEAMPGSDRDLVRVLDFGISKLRNVAGGLTRTVAVIGTPHYMSPEQATGKNKSIDERSDQFSLGTIAYELLTGRRAFSAASAEGDDEDAALTIMYRVVHQEPPTWRSLGLASLPEGLELVVQRAMAKAPAERYPTVRAFSEAFAAVAAAMPSARASSAAVPMSSVGAPRVVPATLLLPDSARRANTTLSMATGEAEAASGRATIPASAGSAVTEQTSRLRRPQRLALVMGLSAVALMGLAIGLARSRSQSRAGASVVELAPAASAPAVAASPPPPPPPTPRDPPPPAAVAATVVSVELEEPPVGLTAFEGDRALPLPLVLPADGRVHHLTFKAPGRRDLATDVAARPGAHVSLRGMAHARPIEPPAPRSKSKTPRAATRNEDIL